MTRTSERKDGTALCTVTAALLVVMLLMCGLPSYAVNALAWADEVEDEPALDGGNQDADTVEPDNTDAEQPALGSDGTLATEAPSEEERLFIDELESLGTKLDEEIGKLEASRVAFDAARSLFTRGVFARDVVLGAGGEASARSEEFDRNRRNAYALIKAVQDELMHSADYGTAALMSGAASPHDIEFRQDLLERLMVAESKKIRQALSDERRLRVELALDGASSRHVRRELRASVLPINNAAYQVERACAFVRQCVKDMQVAVEKASGTHPVLIEAKDAAPSRVDSALALVASAEQAVGSWYDEVDACAGAQGALSFGEGIDFACDEDEFVDVWGTAIDAFFAERANAMGTMPLQGYGREMAASAYRHRIDPRICAAVSIAESSGGQACIKPHNAWGWGAADSNPYELAVEWTSFEEAIEAWHEGMAASTSGLATAKTVSALGALYCSSPAWGATVIEQMELMSNLVR